MHFVASQTSYEQAVQKIQGALKERSKSRLTLVASQGGLSVSTEDRVLSIFCQVEGETLAEGKVAVDSRLFCDVMRTLPNTRIKLELADDFLIVSMADQSEFTMKIPTMTDVMAIDRPKYEAAVEATLNAHQLLYALKNVAYCTQDDSPRAYGSVVFMHSSDEDTVRSVASDGYRLALTEWNTAQNMSFLGEGITVSRRCLNELIKMCGFSQGQIRIEVANDRSLIAGHIEGYSLYMRLSAVKFPNYQGVLPKETHSQALTSKAKLQSALKRVLLASDRKTRAVRLHFDQCDLTLSARVLGSSESRERLSLDNFEGPSFRAIVNGKYLTDVLNTISSEHVKFALWGEGQPFYVLPQGEPVGLKSEHVLVPIRES